MPNVKFELLNKKTRPELLMVSAYSAIIRTEGNSQRAKKVRSNLAASPAFRETVKTILETEEGLRRLEEHALMKEELRLHTPLFMHTTNRLVVCTGGKVERKHFQPCVIELLKTGKAWV